MKIKLSCTNHITTLRIKGKCLNSLRKPKIFCILERAYFYLLKSSEKISESMQNEQTLKMPPESDLATQLKLLNSSEKRSNASDS